MLETGDRIHSHQGYAAFSFNASSTTFGYSSDGRGVTPFTIRLVDGEEERPPIFEHQGEINFTDPRMVAELITGMASIEFPEAGEYRLQFFACNTPLMERRIVVAGPPEAPNA